MTAMEVLAKLGVTADVGDNQSPTVYEDSNIIAVSANNSAMVIDADLIHLRGMTRLVKLDLAGAKITDVGLNCLQDLKQLRWLYLSGTQVADAGLAKLQGLTALIYLELSGTRVTDAGVTAFKRALPDCDIARRTHLA